MDWNDRGLVIGIRRLGETSVILEVMTERHGRHLGVVRAGRSRAMQPTLQQGNSLELIWRARLEEHIGVFAVEADDLRAGRLMASQMALQGLHWLSALLRLLPERDPHTRLYAMADALAAHLDNPNVAPELMVRFEMAVLADLGFGLDIATCAISGSRDELAYVSPKSGRAVGRAAGAPWADRLLPLPAFLSNWVDAGAVSDADVEAGLRLTWHFLRRDLFGPRGLESLVAVREIFAREVRRALENQR